MSGETEENVSGWTTDTLREYMQSRLVAIQLHLQRQIDDMRTMLDERYATQTKAVDAAFVAQQTAMQTALTAAERAVATALLSAEKAVNKAETAAEKRFESVNEFRAQLGDQARTFAPREYVETQFGAVDRRLLDISAARQTALDEARSISAGLLPREVFEAAFAMSASDRQQLRDRIGSLEGEVKSSRRVAAVAVAALGVGFTILTLVLQFLRL